MPMKTERLEMAVKRAVARLSALNQESIGRVLGTIGDEVVQRYRLNIDQGKAPGHGRFAPLSPAYAARKAQMVKGRKAKRSKAGRFVSKMTILRLTDSMYNSFRWVIDRSGFKKFTLTVGASGVDDEGVRNGDKARWHIDGSPPRRWGWRTKRRRKGGKTRKVRETYGVGGLPRRPFNLLPRGLLAQLLSKGLKDELKARSGLR